MTMGYQGMPSMMEVWLPLCMEERMAHSGAQGAIGRKDYISDRVWKSCPVFLLPEEIGLRIILIRGPRLHTQTEV